MHVVLVSHCEKRALKKTRAVLDSYALRSGEHTWMTPITAEGLAELRTMLRRSATRQTAVACFRNDGRARMTLLWTVGNQKYFDRNGVSPVATRQKPQQTRFPDWARQAAMLAALGGYSHDLGKFGEVFQAKLSSDTPKADPVRHEWLSVLILRQLLTGGAGQPEADLTESLEGGVLAESDRQARDWASWQEIWRRLANGAYREVAPFDKTLQGPEDVLLYLVATHHKLPRADGNCIGNGSYVRDKTHQPVPVSMPDNKMWRHIRSRLAKVRSMTTSTQEPLYWRGIATFARMALILADHAVSSEDRVDDAVPAAIEGPTRTAYANTARRGENRVLNQLLDWHLQNVGDRAGNMVFDMLRLTPPYLSQDAIDNICAPATGRFRWQERMAAALSRSRETEAVPHLVLNLAATGSGKTRANVRAVCALNEGQPVRLATALNLRTLTLQTRDAYKDQLGIGGDEVSCVIGDKLSVLLHDYQKSLSRGCGEEVVDEDENTPEDPISTLSEFDYYDAPGWLQHFLRKEPHLAAVIGSPVLVSTTDFLVASGEPHRQGKHALAALRLMTSDLIVDEIDGYDPKALLAVLRMVMMSALFGRHVIASSATLSKPVADLLWRAYGKGAEMRGLLEGAAPSFRTVLVDDQLTPVVLESQHDADRFNQAYLDYVVRMAENTGKVSDGPRRLAYLQTVKNPASVSSFHNAVLTAAKRLHCHQGWLDEASGKTISIGLVRMANIRPAIQVANHLSKSLGHNARVACYHANHLAIQRFHIERRLDHLLTRKPRSQGHSHHITADPEIRRMLDDPACETLMLIVVATPVEEIGRDHDFDWAVIEPSSSQSIVQTGGRVNRHRLSPISEPNIAILQYNRKHIDAEKRKHEGEVGRKGLKSRASSMAPVFTKPGLETPVLRGTTHRSHDLKDLLAWRVEPGELRLPIDARLRFDSENHPFAADDDAATVRATSSLFADLVGEEPAPNITQSCRMWMAAETYTAAPLREKGGNQVQVRLVMATDSPDRYRVEIAGYQHGEATTVDITPLQAPRPNAWLALADSQAAGLAEETGASVQDSLAVGITLYLGKDSALDLGKISRDPDFGFFMT